mmetsp:Transcript_17838/g.34103  ORF Transcript_17838/g.34103 Transcript_17838/m.34103 type:complete len:603 (-) Transcript_17838:187-1995(-)
MEGNAQRAEVHGTSESSGLIHHTHQHRHRFLMRAAGSHIRVMYPNKIQQAEDYVDAAPPGIRWILNIKGSNLSMDTYRTFVLLLTFVCYALFHCTRKIPSVVKSTFDPPDPAASGWRPFDNERNGKELLSGLDFCFLSMYAAGMFYSGHLADSLDLRKFLFVGCMLTGLVTCAYGCAFFLDVHTVQYFYAVQALAGLAQSTAYPAVVAVVANWFGPSKRGLIMGAWAAHMTVGNVLGSVLGAWLLQFGWGWCFVAPGAALVAFSLVILLFLCPHPEDVGYASPSNPHHRHRHARQRQQQEQQQQQHARASDGAGALGLDPSCEIVCEGEGVAPRGASGATGALDSIAERSSGRVSRSSSSSGGSSSSSEEDPLEGLPEPPVAFCTALMLPGVMTYSLCLFFSKLINYTFLFWLPFYISNIVIDGVSLSPEKAGQMSSLFDIGGVMGGVLIGYLSDRLGAKACTTTMFLLLSIPMLQMYRTLGDASFEVNMALLIGSGLLVNGPYALITTAISADLGTHESLQGNAQALATVTAIIDGTGSIGAVVGPLMTGFITQVSNDWSNVFYMLYAAALCAALLLSCLVAKEVSILACPPPECAVPLLR